MILFLHNHYEILGHVLELILDTILAESKEFADDVNDFYKFKKSNKKFKWPWQKANTNLAPNESNHTNLD